MYVEQDEHGQVWYLLLETVREFALHYWRRLRSPPRSGGGTPGTTSAWREQTRAPQPALPPDAFISLLEREHANFRVALDWCQAHGYAEASLRLAVGLAWFWAYVATSPRDAAACEALLASLPLRTDSGSRALVHASALDSLGRMASMQGRHRYQPELEQQSLDLFERMGTPGVSAKRCSGWPPRLSSAATSMARAAHMQRSLELLRGLPTAIVIFSSCAASLPSSAIWGCSPTMPATMTWPSPSLEEANRLTLAAHDVALAWRLSAGQHAARDGCVRSRSRVAEEGLAIVEGEPDGRALAIMLAELGTIATAQRDFRGGYDALARSLSVNEAIGEPSGFSLVFDRFAVLASAQNQHARALHLAGAAAALRERVGTPPSPLVQRQIDRQLEAARAALGGVAASAWAAGRELSLAEAIAETRGTIHASTSSGGHPPPTCSAGASVKSRSWSLAGTATARSPPSS